MTANPNLASDQKSLGKQGAFIDDTAPPMSTSGADRSSGSTDKGSNDRPSNTGACSTNAMPHRINNKMSRKHLLA